MVSRQATHPHPPPPAHPFLFSLSVTCPFVTGMGPLRSLGSPAVTWGTQRGYSMGHFLLSYANPLLVTSPAWGTQAPHCCESRGHLAASGPIIFLSVTVTQPLGSVGSKPGYVDRVDLVLMGGAGVIYPLCRFLAPPRSRWAGGDTFCSPVGCTRFSSFRGQRVLRPTFLPCRV